MNEKNECFEFCTVVDLTVLMKHRWKRNIEKMAHRISGIGTGKLNLI